MAGCGAAARILRHHAVALHPGGQSDRAGNVERRRCGHRRGRPGDGRIGDAVDPHAAALAFTQAIADDPNNADALNDLGIARDLQGNFAGAVEPCSRALLADPSMIAAEVNLGLSLALSGRGEEALQ